MENEFLLNSEIPPQFPFNLSSSPIPIWNSFSSDLNCSSEQSPECFFSSDRNVKFDSGLTSMVSSPAASNSNISNEGFLMRELIGRLGNIGNEIPLFSGDPGFAERAARFSCFGSKSFNGRSNQVVHRSNQSMENGKFFRVSSTPSLGSEMGVHQNLDCRFQDRIELSNSQEESTVSELNVENGLSSRKRKSVSRVKSKDPSQNVAKAIEAKENSNLNAKKCKKHESNEKENGGVKREEEKGNEKVPEPPKDYIHVRARRGQATDSHSLAERVRREKISERMKLLQDLVPGCNKVTGKALMLDEIINYVQSLQRQVEFLSMKLSSVNTLGSKDIFQSNNSSFLSHQNMSMQLPPLDEYCYPTFSDGDLQTIVQMGFRPNSNHDAQNFLGANQNLPTKLEL